MEGVFQCFSLKPSPKNSISSSTWPPRLTFTSDNPASTLLLLGLQVGLLGMVGQD